MVMGKEEVEKKEVEKVEKEEELMVMEKEEVEKREVTFVSLVDSMPPAPDTAPTASTVQQGRSAGLLLARRHSMEKMAIMGGRCSLGVVPLKLAGV